MVSNYKNWWDDFFGEFRPFFSKIPAAVSNREAKYYIKKLKLKKGDSFFDCPCGIGRISLPLAKAGIKVTGIDIAPTYLTELEEKAAKLKLPIKLYHTDMRKVNFENQFDAAGNLWTSFGFFEKESDNFLVLKKIFKALKPGGRFVMQVINRDWIIKNFSPSGWHQFKDMRLLETRTFDLKSSKSLSTWIFVRDGEDHPIDVQIRMYSYHELAGMFEKAGFVDVHAFGSIKEEPLTFDSREQFVFGRKPK